MNTEEHIKNLSSKLTAILRAELKLGNQVVETAKGWPNTTTTIIFLKYPFFNHYELEGVAYSELNDRHYWKAQYTDEAADHILACKFGD